MVGIWWVVARVGLSGCWVVLIRQVLRRLIFLIIPCAPLSLSHLSGILIRGKRPRR